MCNKGVMKLGILKFRNKVLSGAISIMMLFQPFATNIISMTAYAEDSTTTSVTTTSGSSGVSSDGVGSTRGEGSNARVRANIQWAQKKSFQDMNADDLSQLTYDDLRMIGVFLSNFYEPWSTALGVSETEDDTKEKMINVLVKQCNFHKDVAEALVPMIWQMVLDTAKPLNIGVLEKDGTIRKDSGKGSGKLDWDGIKSLDNSDDGGFKGSYYNFLSCWAGNTNIKKEESIINAGANKFCLYWTDNGVDKIVFDTGRNFKPDDVDTQNRRFSASSLAYGLLNDNLDYGNGIGSSIMAVEDYNVFKEIPAEHKDKTAIINSQLYVDCFGDILVDVATNQYILVPACVNPYAWYDYEDGVKTAGDRLNLINSYFIGEAEESHIQKWGDRYYFLVYTGDKSLFNLKYYRLWRNNSEWKLDKEAFMESEETKDLRDRLENQYDLKGGKLFSEAKNFTNWMTYSSYLSKGTNGKYDIKNTGHSTNPPSDFKSDLSVIPNYSMLKFGAYDSAKIDKDNYQSMIMIDSLGAFDSATDENSTVFRSANLFTDVASDAEEASQTISGMTGANKFNGVKGTVTSLGQSSTAKQYFVSIYLSYVFAYYDTSTGADRKVPYAFNKDLFPTDMSNVDFSGIEIENNAMQEEVLSLAYYIMHPKKGLEVVKQWFKNKVSSILCGWHEDMVGAGNGVVTTGSTRYIGFSGYVTIPNLGDLSWTNWLLQQYDALVVYFIIAIIIAMFGYVMIGSLTLQRAILGVLIFSICAYLPPKMIDSTVNVSNLMCDKIYSSKFTYWALVQHQQYASDINSAVAENDEQQYLAKIFQNQAVQNSDNYAVVTLKWQCPKKENYVANIKQEMKEMAGNDNIFRLVSGLVSEQVSGESFDEAAQDLYLYRSYTDVASYAKAAYENGKTYYRDTGISPAISNGMAYANVLAKPKWSNAYEYVQSKSRDSVDLAKDINRYLTDVIYLNTPFTVTESSYKYAVDNGFVLDGRSSGGTGNRLEKNKGYHIVAPLCSPSVAITAFSEISSYPTTVSATINGDPLLNTLNLHLSGLPQQCFNNTLHDLNQVASEGAEGSMKVVGGTDTLSNATTVDKEDAMSLFNFALYTESPFYYFSYNLQDQLQMMVDGEFQEYYADGSVVLDTKAPDNPTYSDLFLASNGQYFFNNKLTAQNGIAAGYGEMRDFMDMRSLFTVVMPYLHEVNKIVVEWDEKYGLYMYDDADLQYNENYELVLPSGLDNIDSDEFYRYWHNANVAQLLNLYTPWVDTMYSCDYAKPETIYVAGEKYVVENPLNPWSYVELSSTGAGATTKIIGGRPMVFSRSEMAYYGLNMDDLTQVEQKIITMYDDVYASLLQLMDYYSFEPEVLNTGAAMLETFAFNKNFSETDLFGEDYTLYPQSYELKNFSYDAFLRLILAETTGEDISKSYEDNGGSFYMAVINNSSILTGIMFIAVDLLACYAIPALKLFFLLAIFAMSVLLILSAVVKIEISLPRVLWTSLVSPLLKFFAVTVGMAFAVSLFMSDGNRSVTHRNGFAIGLGDPVMVLIVMLLINILVLVLYFKIVKKCFQDCVKYGKSVYQSAKGMVGGVLSGAVVGSALATISGKINKDSEFGGTHASFNTSNTTSGVSAGMSGASPEQRGKQNVGRKTVMPHSNRRAVRRDMRRDMRRELDGAAKRGNNAQSNSQNNPYNQKIDKYGRMDMRRDADMRARDRWRDVASDANASQRMRDKAESKVRAYDRKLDKLNRKYSDTSFMSKRKVSEARMADKDARKK